MFDTRFNSGYQNTVMPLNTDPYTQSGMLPNMMNNNIPYPAPPSQSMPAANMPGQNSVAYAGGGKVKKKKASKEKSPYPMLAEMIRKQGNGEDTILAHINPLEAMMLKEMGGSGTINKKTGLPQFGIFNSTGKWFKSVLGPAAGVVIGNMLLPGIGGVIGGALGGATGSVFRGRKDFKKAALRGGMMGAAAPTGAALLGSGANAVGATGIGGSLSNYGAQNAILPSIGLGNMFGGEGAAGAAGAASSGSGAASGAASKAVASEAATKAASEVAARSWTDRLIDPKNLLSMGSLAASVMGRPKEKKEKTPEQQADEHKRLQKELMLTPEERSAKENELVAEEQMKRRVARKKFLLEERFGDLDPVYRKSHDSEERKKHGKWFSYYNNPNYTGTARPYQEGGEVSPDMMYEAEEAQFPDGSGRYVQGETGGRDDKIKALLSDGEYVIPADAVAHLGDGNNTAGAKRLDQALKNIRKQRGGSIHKLPPKAKSLTSYLRG
jgi:hypothetical protein